MPIERSKKQRPLKGGCMFQKLSQFFSLPPFLSKISIERYRFHLYFEKEIVPFQTNTRKFFRDLVFSNKTNFAFLKFNLDIKS